MVGGSSPTGGGWDGPWLRSGEVAQRLGLTYDTLRGWERSGLIRAARDPGTGWRRFGPEDLDRLVVIRALRQSGYSPMAVLRMLTAAERGEPAQAMGTLLDPGGDEDLVTASDRWAATLDEHERCAVQAIGLATAIAGRSVNPP
jgi:excisionase family DNA binding protein